MKSIFILIILVIFLIGLFLWEIWPDRVEIINLDSKKDQANQIQTINCRSVDSLFERQWEIRYPYSLSKNETKEVSVLLLDSSLTHSSISAGESECDIAIEVILDISNIIIKPGPRIIEPFHPGSPLRFEWIVQAVDGDASGTIWIYVLSDESTGQLFRYPLFVLPVKIRNYSLMGISPRLLRIILFALIFIGSGIYLLLRPNERE